MKRLLFIAALLVSSLLANSQFFMNGSTGIFATAGGGTPDTTYDATVGLFNICGGGCATVSGFTQLTPLGEPDDANHSGTDTYTLASQTGGWVGIPASVGTSGATTSDGGGFYHGSSTANQSYYFTDGFTAPTTTTSAYSFRISGLTEDSLYIIDIVCSRVTNDNFGQYKVYDKNGEGSIVTTFWDGTTINAKNNTSKYVRLFLRATSSGDAFVWLGGTTSSYFAYANTISIQKVTISPYPYALFRPVNNIDQILAEAPVKIPLPHLHYPIPDRLVMEAILPGNKKKKKYV